jgi:hypothetical protein
MGDVQPHSSPNAFFARFSSLARRFRPDNGEVTELPQPSPPSRLDLHALIARLTPFTHRFPPENDAPDELQQPSTPSRLDLHSLIARLTSFTHRSPPENDAPDELQQSSMPSRLDPHVLLARLSSLFPRSRLSTDEGAEPHPTTPLSSPSDALINRLSSLFRSQPHTNEDIELPQCPSRPLVVNVAAVRDREVCLSLVCVYNRHDLIISVQALVVARGPEYMKAKQAYEQQAQASSSRTCPIDSTTTTGAAVAQSPPISWWARIVLFLCCA